MLIDNSAVERQNETHLRSSPDAMANVELCFAAVDLLRSATELGSFTDDDDITMLRLGIRLINDAGACGTCALGGYYQQAATHIRDIIELEFLLDLFRREPAEIAKWRGSEEKVRRNEYSAYALRKRLDAMDESTSKSRDAAYRLFSQHGTHADPWKIQLISPNMRTMVGPFPSEQWIVALSFDLSRHLAFATWHIARWVEPVREIDPVSREKFQQAFRTLNALMFRHFDDGSPAPS